jgi:AraC family transcriptional regulator, regulatory protein of adaptative response / methylated-DNA-[protein]-cysteine methyltransferase
MRAIMFETSRLQTENCAAPLRAKETIRYELRCASLGWALIAASDKGVCALLLGDDAQALRDDLHARLKDARLVEGECAPGLADAVLRFIEAPDAPADFPIDARGTPFQQRVWRALRAIPAGATASYAEIADKIGAPRSTRAVASACAANPVAVAIPCHRVLRSDGGLSGYRWGVERKRRLLAREKIGAP